MQAGKKYQLAYPMDILKEEDTIVEVKRQPLVTYPPENPFVEKGKNELLNN